MEEQPVNINELKSGDLITPTNNLISAPIGSKCAFRGIVNGLMYYEYNGTVRNDTTDSCVGKWTRWICPYSVDVLKKGDKLWN